MTDDPTSAETDIPLGDNANPLTAPQSCSQCGALRVGEGIFCGDCGFIFATEPAQAATVPEAFVAGRYRLTELLGERSGVARYRGADEGTLGTTIPVIVVRQRTPDEPGIPPTIATEIGVGSEFEFDLPDVPSDQATMQIAASAGPNVWPGVGWEESVLLRAAHLSLPRLIDSFTEDGYSYLIEEVATGMPLWDAWDRTDVSNRDRYGWLAQIAGALDRLHFAGAIVEGLRPEMIVVSPNGAAILADLSELLPLPLPGDVPLRGGFATAPELLLNPTESDARADLFAFGALLYALLLGRELSDLDFTLTGTPKHILERLPDANPFVVRVLARTFVRDPGERFPTSDGALIDPTGFQELIGALGSCRRNLDRVKIDVAAWSTVGMVRSGNEDGVTIFHTGDGRLDDTDEAALIVLADGMGGMASGEVAAAIALHALRQELLASPPFSAGLPVTPLPEPPAELEQDGAESPGLDENSQEPEEPSPIAIPQFTVDPESPERSVDAHAERIATALREANHRVFTASQAHHAARGMGCTAEVVLIDGATAIGGHVGDSRVYRMRGDKLNQITRDHTLVGRLVELGQITEAEAEVHPRRSELHQAIGGRPDVYPDVYAIALEPGDWIIVCSDGLSNQVSLDAMQSVLREARNAERAARRLVNLALYEGAMDNVTVAVVRVA